MTDTQLDTMLDTTLRTLAAELEKGELAATFLMAGWSIDLATFPGTLTAAKGNARVFYPAGVGGRWDTVISEMRPTDGLAATTDGLGVEVVAWQVRLTQSTPVAKVVAIAEQAVGTPVIYRPGASEILEEVEDFFRTDDLTEGDGDAA
jgi:hypothetical protein